MADDKPTARVWTEPPTKFEAFIPVSAEMLEDTRRMAEAWQSLHAQMATPEGRAAMAAQQKARADARRAHVEQARADHAELLTRAAGLAAKVLALHEPGEDGDCSGCEFGGYESEPAGWPCSTYVLAAEDVGASFVADPVWSWERLVVDGG